MTADPRALPADTRRAREIVVLTACAIGLPHMSAAHQLDIAPRTFRRALQSACDRLGAISTANAVALALLAGELDPEQIRVRALPAWPERPAVDQHEETR